MAQKTEAGWVKMQEERSTTPSDTDFGFSDMLSDLRATFNSGKTKKLTWRKEQLRQVMKMCQENHLEMAESIRVRHKGSKLRGFLDIGATFEDASIALNNLDAWTTPETCKHLDMHILGKSIVRREAKGVCMYPVFVFYLLKHVFSN